ncbi:MAG: amino acid ABC transporter permease [Eggerthellaceae bacterium]|nr:amino acid ABC transporter permease [Eggerthellaceae bacterium]
MNNTARPTSPLRLLFAALCAAVVAVTVMLALPADAQALETSKCSARPNASAAGDNSILGATETRITWEGMVEEGEGVSAVSLTLPAGTAFATDNARATLLTGDDLMTRNAVDVQFSAEGQTVTAEFSEPITAAGCLRLEIYGVFFPAEGGAMQITGTYELSDGATRELSSIPAIAVVGVNPFEQLSNFLAEQEWVQAWNSNKFCKLFLDPTLLVTSFPVVFWGFLQALGIVACAFPLAIPIGLVLALMRMSKFRVLRGIATTYVNVVRGTPLFLQIYIAFFGLPLAGIQVPSFPLGVIVLFMNSGAYLCEIFRAGIQSIPKGQFEASRSLGMNGAQTMVFVIIPQTVRRVIPTMTSEFILLYKDTSMLAAVGVMEVVMYAKTIVASTGSITPYIVAACFYLVITLPLAKVVGNLEARLAGTPKKKRRKKAKDSGAVQGDDASAGAAGTTGAGLGVAASTHVAGVSTPDNPKLADAQGGDYVTPEKMSSL